MKDPRSALPWLWVFMLVNYLYCDIVSLLDPEVMRQELLGKAANGAIAITPEFLLAAGVMMEIPMAMIVLSRILPGRANRWANVAAAALMGVIQIGSLGVGAPAGYYLFFSAIEIGTLAAIALIGWRGTWSSTMAAA